jgi:periplasmic protein CpxP/Spy
MIGGEEDHAYLNKEAKMSKTIRSRFSVILAIGALLTWIVCVPAEVRAEPSPGMTRGSHHSVRGGHMSDFVGHSLHGLLRHKKDLDLSADQSARIKAIATDYTKTRIREEADLKLAEVDVRTLVRDEKADLTAIETAMKKSESAHTALRLEGVKALRAAAAVLTPEQREKWRAVRMERHREGHGEGKRSREYSQERAG